MIAKAEVADPKSSEIVMSISLNPKRSGTNSISAVRFVPVPPSVILETKFEFEAVALIVTFVEGEFVIVNSTKAEVPGLTVWLGMALMPGPAADAISTTGRIAITASNSIRVKRRRKFGLMFIVPRRRGDKGTLP